MNCCSRDNVTIRKDSSRVATDDCFIGCSTASRYFSLQYILPHDLTKKVQGDCLAVHPGISRLEETRRESLMLASYDCFMELNVSLQFVQPLLDISASNIEPQVSTLKGPRKLQESSSADFALLNLPSNQSFLILFVP